VADRTPDVSIVVLGWRRAPELVRCLRALNESDSRATREVVVVLNEPDAELIAELEGHTDLFDLIDVSPVNRGYGVANNDAVERASGETIVLLNDDAIVKRGFLDPLIDRLEAEGTVGAVGSLQVNERGRIVEAGAFLYDNGAPLQIDEAVLGGDAPRAEQVLYVSGAALAVRRRAFIEVGGFDAGYFPAYFEDADLALKLLGLGLTTWLEPASVVVHHHARRAPRRYAAFLTERNRARFALRWAPVLGLLPEHPSSFRPQGIRRDVDRVRVTLSELAQGERFRAMTPDEPRPADAELRDRSAVLTSDYAVSLEATLDEATERIAELEAIESHLQVLVAERQDVLDRYVPRVAELEATIHDLEDRLAALDLELADYRGRLVVRASEKAAGLTRRLAPSLAERGSSAGEPAPENARKMHHRHEDDLQDRR